MAWSLWLPFGLAVFIYFLMGLLVCFVKETKSEVFNTSHLPNPQEDSEPLLTTSTEIDNQHQETQSPILYEPSHDRHPWRETFRLLISPDLSLVLFCFFAKRIGFTSEIFFSQYASEKFHLILRQTPWFPWAQAFGSALMLGLGLPLFTSQLQRRNLSTRRIDLLVIYFSLFILTVGFFAAWRAPSPIVFGAGESESLDPREYSQFDRARLAILLCGFGEGAAPALQGLASSFVTPTQNARLFTCVTLLDTAGRFISGPLLAKLHQIGRNSDHEPNGAMFLVSSVSNLGFRSDRATLTERQCLFGSSLLLACFIKHNRADASP